MLFIHLRTIHSCGKMSEVYQNKIAFFRDAYTDSTIKKVYWLSYHPLAPIKNSSAIEFSVPASPRDYIDLSKSKLYVKGRILKENGDEIAQDTKVFMNNLMLWVLFRQFELLINNTPLTAGVNINSPYKSFLDCLLNTSEGQQLSLLESEGFYKDARDVEATTPLVGNNPGAFARSQLTALSRVFDLIGGLRPIDISAQDKLILNGLPLVFRLFRSSDNFILMSG